VTAEGNEPDVALLDPWADAALAIELFAVDPFLLKGVTLHGWPGPQRDTLCGWIRALLPEWAPMLRVPLHVTDDRLLGGVSLAATLQAGRVIEERGLLVQAHGGVLVLPMAERIEPNVASHLGAALDRGELLLAREGLAGAYPARVGVVALDEGIDGERAPAALRDRLGFEVQLGLLDPQGPADEPPEATRVARARGSIAEVTIDDAHVEALCRAGEVLGITSLRAPLLAVGAARAHAALQGRAEVGDEDTAVAARLVLGPRATRIPVSEPEESEPQQPEPENDDAEQIEPDRAARPEPQAEGDGASQDRPLEDLVVEAARSGIPAGLLDALALGRERRASSRRAGHAGELRVSNVGGRPAGVVARMPSGDERLNVVETLRAAAPWQPLRRREQGLDTRPGRGPILLRRDDFRVTRFQQRAETRVIFAVDASGSAALQRLAEAKGAVEQVLADCYVRRDHVALVAFRGKGTVLLLPPTRSLVHVRRSLAGLAGGGTTPLAAGIDAALGLAIDARKRGQTPVLVMMTDGRANIARDGQPDRAAGEADALAGARSVRALGIRTLFLDTSPRPRDAARLLAEAMGAKYLPLPYLDAVGISRQVQLLAASAS